MSQGEWRRLFQTSDEYDFDPDILRLQQQHPSPLPRAVLWGLLALLLCLLLWALFGRLDIIAVAHGKLVPQSAVKIVQAADAGIVKELLVSEGDEVAAGQIVARMDAVFSDADNRTLDTELALKQLQLRRIDAELKQQALAPLPEDSPELFAGVLKQYQARRQAYLDSLESARATRARAEQDLQGALEIERKLEQTLPGYRQQSEAFQKLVEKGYVSRLMANEKSRELIEREQDLRAQRHSVKSLRATIVQAERQIDQISSSYREELQNERIVADGDYRRLQQELEKQTHRHELLEVRAPQDGIVKDIATHTPGTVVSVGTVLMTVVPRNDPLEAEVWLSHIDAGFVRPGQHARVKLMAYSFQKYGMLEGQVDQISPDAVDNEEAMRSGIQGYKTVIALAGNQLESHTGQRYRLTPGMQVSAEINLGSRSVIEYLLSPVQKTAQEAGRER
ncbi:MAG: HlyD family type I secretion periplasmic adaptor subunit [Mariprofundaceae bacterium]|nr:HlyD family type I secretion periplasmic adaptor subunit [Mariprofundaceae bacterium]